MMREEGEPGREPGSPRFEELRSRGQRAVEAGRLEEAAGCVEQALDWASREGDNRQVDLVLCNRAAVAIQLGRGDGELPRLREILLRNDDKVNCRLAAYHLSIYYQFQKNYKKSRFYAKLACDRAELLGVMGVARLEPQPARQRPARRELHRGGLPRVTSRLSPFDARRPGDLGRALILHNLGYCRVLQRRQ